MLTCAGRRGIKKHALEHARDISTAVLLSAEHLVGVALQYGEACERATTFA